LSANFSTLTAFGTVCTLDLVLPKYKIVIFVYGCRYAGLRQQTPGCRK